MAPLSLSSWRVQSGWFVDIVSAQLRRCTVKNLRHEKFTNFTLTGWITHLGFEFVQEFQEPDSVNEEKTSSPQFNLHLNMSQKNCLSWNDIFSLKWLCSFCRKMDLYWLRLCRKQQTPEEKTGFIVMHWVLCEDIKQTLEIKFNGILQNALSPGRLLVYGFIVFGDAWQSEPDLHLLVKTYSLWLGNGAWTGVLRR